MKKYGLSFDSESFYGWVKKQSCPVYFSSVLDIGMFQVVWEKEQKCKMNRKVCKLITVREKLFWNGI